MVYRVYVEKKPSEALEAKNLLSDINSVLLIDGVNQVRLLNRYDVEGLSKEYFETAVRSVLSEPQLDNTCDALDLGDATVFAVEYLPGQFDQRADSAAQCIQFITKAQKPIVRSAKIYALYGKVSEEDLATIKKYVINPVEAREASFDLPETLNVQYDIPTTVATLDGFCKKSREELAEVVKSMGLAMDLDDLSFCQNYFLSEHRDPTITEIRMIDTYWSDHCRHTTFLTVIDDVKFEDELLASAYADYIKVRADLGRTKPICLMDMATLAVKALKKAGKLDKLDESEEINACTVKMDVEVNGENQKWLLLFKNETHNHPTEIEPFGGAATCIGGAIRDPLSGRSYVYGAMRVTGAADPTVPVKDTIPGKLPQRKLVTTAAAGYASYGNQIGLATGIVDEIYHPGYAAKRMEIGAVIAATPEENVRRECPAPGDVVLLLGGSTGRDGIGGATGSSKAHNAHSVETCGAEVQKGNAPEERKLQRLFRNAEACKMIKRCNDFGAGGVSVAIGELADGLSIDLNAVPKKYEGLDGTELAISESQERMAVVVAPEDAEKFLSIADKENLQAVRVAVVTEKPYLTMNWNGNTIVNISRDFLNSNGADKHITISPKAPEKYEKPCVDSFASGIKTVASDLNSCSKRGLSERFDSTIGAGTVLMPFGGKYQQTPIQAMVQKISIEKQHTDLCSLMAYGYNPQISEKSPYHGAYLAVIESVSKLIATGAEFKDVYLTFQEYFCKPGQDGARWGQPMSALLGAFKAQMNLGIGAIGGKDSMSGSFEDLDVPPTLVSFAVTTENVHNILSPEFKKPGHKVYLLRAEVDANGLPDTDSFLALLKRVNKLNREGKIVSCYTPGMGGIAEAVMKMGFGNGCGFAFDSKNACNDLFAYAYGSFLVEATEDLEDAAFIGIVTKDFAFAYGEETVCGKELQSIYENKLESVYPCNIAPAKGKLDTFTFITDKKIHASVSVARPKVLIPAFPGTNCELDSAKAARDAGLEPEVFVVRNLTSNAIAQSIEAFAKSIQSSQMIFIPGGFSGGDEPDGSAKFITAFFRSSEIKDAVEEMLYKRDGLMLGICNGFQALIKLGLLPYGHIIETDKNCPTLTFNSIGRHQSRIVRTRVASNLSPWLTEAKVGEVYSVPISHGEGKFLASDELIAELAKNGQIATQYVDLNNMPSNDVHFNPNGSCFAVEGITSPDGRILGKMGHSERIDNGLYQNVPGNYDIGLFRSAFRYFK